MGARLGAFALTMGLFACTSAGAAHRTRTAPPETSRPRDLAPRDRVRAASQLGVCLDEDALRSVPVAARAGVPTAGEVQWIARSRPGPPGPEDVDLMSPRDRARVLAWDLRPTWSLSVRIEGAEVPLEASPHELPALRRGVDDSVVAALRSSAPPEASGPIEWVVVPVGASLIVLAILSPTPGGRVGNNYGCASLSPLRPIARFVRVPGAPVRESLCVVHANEPRDACGPL